MAAEDLRKAPPREGQDWVSLEVQDGVTRVSIGGEVDLSRFEQIDGVLASASPDTRVALEIDLGAVSFMDSQGIRLLVRARERAIANGHQLVIVDPSPFVLRLFQITGLGDLLELTSSSSTDQPR